MVRCFLIDIVIFMGFIASDVIAKLSSSLDIYIT